MYEDRHLVAKSIICTQMLVLQSRNNKRFYIVQTKILTMERMRNAICIKTLEICSEQLKSKIGNFQCHLQSGPFNVAFHICAEHMTYLRHC